MCTGFQVLFYIEQIYKSNYRLNGADILPTVKYFYSVMMVVDPRPKAKTLNNFVLSFLVSLVLLSESVKHVRLYLVVLYIHTSKPVYLGNRQFLEKKRLHKSFEAKASSYTKLL